MAKVLLAIAMFATSVSAAANLRVVNDCKVGPTSHASNATTCFIDTGKESAKIDSVVGYGILKSRGDSFAYSTTLTAGANTNSNIAFADTFTINAPGLAGKTGTASASLLVNWAYDLQLQGGYPPGSVASVSAYVLLELLTRFNTSLGGASRREDVAIIVDASGTHDSSHQEAFNDGQAVAFGSPMTSNFSFTFGQPLTLDVQLVTSSGAGQMAAAYIDAGHSIYWGGIGSVRYDGAPVLYSIESNSGTDWSQSFAPVPEPSSVVLFSAAGLGLLLLRRRPQI